MNGHKRAAMLHPLRWTRLFATALFGGDVWKGVNGGGRNRAGGSGSDDRFTDDVHLGFDPEYPDKEPGIEGWDGEWEMEVEG